MKKILLVTLILTSLTNAQTNFNKGFGEYSFGSSFDSIVQRLTKKHFVSLKVDYNDVWLNVFNHSYVVLECEIRDSPTRQWFTFQFFNDSLFAIGLGGFFEPNLDNQFRFIFETENHFFAPPHDKYPRDADDFRIVDQIRIRFNDIDGLLRYEIQVKRIEEEYNEIAKKVNQIQQNGYMRQYGK